MASETVLANPRKCSTSPMPPLKWLKRITSAYWRWTGRNENPPYFHTHHKYHGNIPEACLLLHLEDFESTQVFSDESHFQLCPDDPRRCVWRRPGQRADPAFTIARHTDPQPGLMVWGAISFDRGTSLVTSLEHTYSPTVRRRNSENCFATVPSAVPWPYFSEDKGRPHVERVAMNCLTACRTLPWSARSPDLSSIEHVWDMMRRRFHLPGNVDDLSQLFEQIWREIQQETIRDQGRRRFVEWAQNEIAVVPDFHKRILFSNEAHFWLNGYVNKQNCRIWSEANPQVYVETPLHPEKLTVWCALWAGGILLQKR
ncbi:transposable element Tc1 transposase [Trichonephila clavipes]|nr:transposable element Tc1 transposase [Trichonephila clavipes]